MIIREQDVKSFFLSAFLFVSLCLANAWAQAPKHYVFLVHGIGATPKTFGPMEEALSREAAGFNQQIDWKFSSFTYETGNDTKNVVTFAKELGDFIATKFKENGGLYPGDKYSLIMHSQGGLIGLNFLLNSFKENPDFHPELKLHLDAFISLGTPYWGAKIAIFANRMMPILSYLKIPLSDKWGAEELTDMELGSDFGAQMRFELMSPSNRGVIQAIKQKARFLVFSGVTERLNFLAPLASGKGRYEDDTAVPIPSSRMDFIYYSDLDNYHEEVQASDFNQTLLVEPENYIVVNAFHSSPFPQNKDAPGIAKLPERCRFISYVDCNHPTYPMLVEHLFGLKRSPAFVRDLTSFAVELKLNFNGYPVDKKRMTIAFKAMTTGLKIGKDIELYNNVSRWTDEGDFRLYHTGTIDPKKTSVNLGKIEMTIKAPGLKDRVVIVPVRTSYSSFVELEM